eukprot:ANDGO_01147.mRNA.1 Decapping nuclease DXO homolog
MHRHLIQRLRSCVHCRESGSFVLRLYRSYSSVAADSTSDSHHAAVVVASESSPRRDPSAKNASETQTTSSSFSTHTDSTRQQTESQRQGAYGGGHGVHSRSRGGPRKDKMSSSGKLSISLDGLFEPVRGFRNVYAADHFSYASTLCETVPPEYASIERAAAAAAIREPGRDMYKRGASRIVLSPETGAVSPPPLIENMYDPPRLLTSFSTLETGSIAQPGTLSLFRSPSVPFNSLEMLHSEELALLMPLPPFNGAPPKKFLSQDRPAHEDLDHMLATLRNVNRLSESLTVLRPRFITFRKVLSRFLSLGFDWRESIRFRIHRLHDCLYMDCVSHTSELERDHLYHKVAKAFEAACTGVSYSTAQNTSFAAIFATRLAGHAGLMAAEVDCVDAGGYFRELKTAVPFHAISNSTAAFKWIRTWAQSFLVGTPRVTYGFRSREAPATISDVKTYDVARIPDICADYWTPASVLSFSARLLGVLLDETEEGAQYIVDVSGEKNSLEIEMLPIATPSFLPTWYVRFLQQRMGYPLPDALNYG